MLGAHAELVAAMDALTRHDAVALFLYAAECLIRAEHCKEQSQSRKPIGVPAVGIFMASHCTVQEAIASKRTRVPRGT